MALFSNHVALCRTTVEAVHGDEVTLYAAKRVGGVNGKMERDFALDPIVLSGCLHQDIDREDGGFWPDPAGMVGGVDRTLNRVGDLTCSVALSEDKVSEGDFLHVSAAASSDYADQWFEVVTITPNGLGQLELALAKARSNHVCA